MATLLAALLTPSAARAQTAPAHIPDPAAVKAMAGMSFQPQEGDGAQLYARIQERGGEDNGTMEFLGTYRLTMSQPSRTRPGAKTFVAMFNTSDIRHSTIVLPREDQKMILAIFSDIAIQLDEDMRGQKVLNWDAVTDRFERFKDHAGQRSKADALKLALFGTVYMQEDFWKSALDAVFDLQKARCPPGKDRFSVDVARQVPGNMLATKASRLNGRREIVPTGFDQGKIVAKTATTYETSELVKSFEESPIGKLLQGTGKGLKMTIDMRSDGVVIYNPEDGWMEHYAERLVVSSDAGGKKSVRDAIIQYRQKRLGL